MNEKYRVWVRACVCKQVYNSSEKRIKLSPTPGILHQAQNKLNFPLFFRAGPSWSKSFPPSRGRQLTPPNFCSPHPEEDGHRHQVSLSVCKLGWDWHKFCIIYFPSPPRPATWPVKTLSRVFIPLPFRPFCYTNLIYSTPPKNHPSKHGRRKQKKKVANRCVNKTVSNCDED